MSFGDRFLSEPDLFPARQSGEPWGSVAIELDLPGGPYLVDGLLPVQCALVQEQLGAHCRIVDGPLPAGGTRATVFRAASSDFKTFDLRGWEYVLDTDCEPQAVRLAGLELSARLDWRPALRGALWTCDGGTEKFPGIFENFCRVLVAYRLLECGGAVLHAAGVARHGAGFLFVGRSGAGKTTVSRASLAVGAEVLSDDLNALVPTPEGPCLAKLPFTGDLGTRTTTSSTWPLAAFLRLEKSDHDELTPLSRATTLAQLAACAPFVNTDRHRCERLIANLESLIPRTPAYALRFAIGGTFWSILDAKWSRLTEEVS